MIAFAMALLVFQCDSKEQAEKKDQAANFNKELACCAWTEASGGNTFEYTFSEEFFTVVANSQKWGDFTISKIEDEKRFFVLYAKKSKKYKDVWWEVINENSVQISQMVGGKYYDSLEAALAAQRTGKWMPLKKKVK